MSYQYDKQTGDIVIGGFDKGVSNSPHLGIANLQNVNISTETGEVMVSYGRTKQTTTNSTATGTITATSNGAVLTVTGLTITNGIWITLTSSSITGLSNGDYFVVSNSSNVITLSQYFYNGSTVPASSNGTASFTIKVNMGKGISSATEKYTDSNGVFQFRYYVLDINGYVWVNDTGFSGFNWFLPDFNTRSGTGLSSNDGIGILNGWLFYIGYGGQYWKSTVNLGDTTSNNTTWQINNYAFTTGVSAVGYGWSNMPNNPNPRFVFVGNQNTLYYTDGRYIGSIFPNSAIQTGNLTGINIQSFCRFTAPTGGNASIGTLTNVISGSLPSNLLNQTRVPVSFFASAGGAEATATPRGKIIWIALDRGNKFQAFAAATGGSALDLVSGSSGLQYFNTFYPVTESDTSAVGSITYNPQHLNLPTFEVAQTINEIGSTLLVGCKLNTVYPWNQIDPLSSNEISLPENDVKQILNVNNMGFIFAGNKGNIYITNGSSASPVISVPDYCAGTPGSASTYIEPYFIWGGAMYLRGRVYFSIQDQTANKTTGNCGGIWSFIPTQNMFYGQDQGISLRLENQNSYSTYNGMSNILIPAQNQQAISPQYWSAWSSTAFSNSTYGIDFTDTHPVGVSIIETDLIPIGTMLNKKTYTTGQIEYKVSSPLSNGESVTFKYRTNATDAWASLGSLVSDNSLSGYYTQNFQKAQWLQLQATLTPLETTGTSFVRLSEIRIR